MLGMYGLGMDQIFLGESSCNLPAPPQYFRTSNFSPVRQLGYLGMPLLTLLQTAENFLQLRHPIEFR